MVRVATGASYPAVSDRIVRCSPIPLPCADNPAKSLAEQRRIAAILDGADSIRRQRRKVVGINDELIPSLFNDAFRKWLDQPVNAMSQLGNPELAEVVSGVTKGRHFNGQPTVIVPYIRVANVQDGYLDLSEVKTIEALPSDVQSLNLQHGDVLMTEGGDFDKLGRGAMYEADIPDCIHQNHVFRIRCNRSRMLPVFFATYIRTQFAKAYFLKCAKKTSNLASINMTQLRALPVACPPMDLQKRFAREVEVIHHVKRQQGELADHANDLFGSLVQRAFRGEL
jgi:type I restriction enzyme S subunit